MIGIYIHIMGRESLIGSLRGAQPLFIESFPLSFEGEGDKGGEVDK
jgi:hypothetical protein